MTPESRTVPSLRGDPTVKRELQRLCRTDNWTNLRYIGRAWLIILVAAALAISAFPTGWAIPAAIAAVLVIGASQHQLAGATHEATHHTLFRSRLFNELASDWLCMFPLFSSTYTFRLYHLQHHQFINDPDRDPDFAMLRRSGHWIGFPADRGRIVRLLLSQLWLIGLLRYAAVRFLYNAIAAEDASPYRTTAGGTKVPLRISLIFIATLAVANIALYRSGRVTELVMVSTALWVTVAVVLVRLPSRHYASSRIRPVYPRRYLAASRMAFITLVVCGLTTTQALTAVPVWWFFLVLWVVPLVSTFQFFMILRQLVQHANCDRSFIGNSRVFLVNPLLRYAVFPFGMDYHAPHHMFATVPHYRLPELHALLSEQPEYRQQCVVAKNYFRGQPTQIEPTIVETLGPSHAPSNENSAWLDNSVLDDWQVDERDAILLQSRLSAQSLDETESAGSVSDSH